MGLALLSGLRDSSLHTVTVLYPPGNVSKGGWKRHHGPETDIKW